MNDQFGIRLGRNRLGFFGPREKISGIIEGTLIEGTLTSLIKSERLLEKYRLMVVIPAEALTIGSFYK